MNTGLKNKLLAMATAAGIAGFGVGCGGSSSTPAAEEGAAQPTSGGEASCSGAAKPAGGAAAPAEGAAPAGGEAKGGEGSCGENSCS
jgi:hypothetical protein